ncbi:MAG TPA: dihydroorotase [Stellaceae bacterium]|jgi:dihydroorotase|nr:dihydroorotase [Stellaceae bacterium]
MSDTITIRRPDDWHVHLRDGAMLKAVIAATARSFARAIVMPNLVPPVTTAAAAAAYRARILAALPPELAGKFTPLMTCYLTDGARADEIERGFKSNVFAAVKLYPAHATTNSASGVTDLAKVRDVLAMMERLQMPLLIHGEVTDASVDVFDRERVFIERVLTHLVRDFPGLKLVLEHVTTKDAVEFVRSAGPTIGATITAHHLVINRNAIFAGGLRPHMYCLPIAKRESHRLALRQAAVSGDGKFFLGTDSAPHPLHDKEKDCGCAGIFSAPTALETYAQVFDEENALDKLEAFASLNGPGFYGLPANEERITLKRETWTPAAELSGDAGGVRVFRGGEKCGWRIRSIV